MFAYVAEHPVAEQANRFFQRSLYDADERMGRVKEQVVTYNETLLPAITEALQAAKARAKERRRFAAGLTLPLPRKPGSASRRTFQLRRALHRQQRHAGWSDCRLRRPRREHARDRDSG